MHIVVPNHRALVFASNRLPLKVQTATDALLQSCIDGKYSDFFDQSMIRAPPAQNRLVTQLKYVDFEILIESEGRLLIHRLVDGKDG